MSGFEIPNPVCSLKGPEFDGIDDCVEVGQVFITGEDEPVVIHFRERGCTFFLTFGDKIGEVKMGKALSHAANYLVKTKG